MNQQKRERYYYELLNANLNMLSPNAQKVKVINKRHIFVNHVILKLVNQINHHMKELPNTN